MTKVRMEKVKCVKCGKESEQMTVYSVNYRLGRKEDNDKLCAHQQVCPNCNYTASRISLDINKK